MSMHTRTGTILVLSALFIGCSTSAASTTTTSNNTATPTSAPTAPKTTAAAAATATEPTAEPLPPVTATYPWRPTATDRLDGRFKAPAGFTRVQNEEGSFGAFLRTLPLLPEGALVVDYRGRPLYNAGHHPSVVSIVDLDIGDKDLQHCADVIVRLHAEWRFGKGERDMTYRAVSGQPLSYRGYAAGDRAVPEGTRISMQRMAGAHNADDHVFFRGWLTDVFNWVGTASLERDATKVIGIADVRPGDFFVKSGSPFGHSVLILDVAKDTKGRTALLLGQSFMPAQSFQILKPASPSADGGVWFVVDAGDIAVDTPFWPAFPMGSLRRFG
jgi:hypothetical protein